MKEIKQLMQITQAELRAMFEKNHNPGERYEKGRKIKGMDVSGCYKHQPNELRWWGYVDAARDLGVLK